VFPAKNDGLPPAVASYAAKCNQVTDWRTPTEWKLAEKEQQFEATWLFRNGIIKTPIR
jgi:hypothetical protein